MTCRILGSTEHDWHLVLVESFEGLYGLRFTQGKDFVEFSGVEGGEWGMSGDPALNLAHAVEVVKNLLSIYPIFSKVIVPQSIQHCCRYPLKWQRLLGPNHSIVEPFDPFPMMQDSRCVACH
jgi:hypothetical protein